MANWNLFEEMDQIRKELNQAFGGFEFNRFIDSAFAPGLGTYHYPKVNLWEDDDNVYLGSLLPGVDPKEVDISVMRNTLTISGERKDSWAGQENVTWHRRERGFGKFLRTVELPAEVNSDQVKAEYQNGMLLVTMPKVEYAKPRRIDVKFK